MTRQRAAQSRPRLPKERPKTRQDPSKIPPLHLDRRPMHDVLLDMVRDLGGRRLPIFGVDLLLVSGAECLRKIPKTA